MSGAILTPGDHRAYTLKPHWAHAIAHLGKRCENRNTPIPKGLVGTRIAIHAGASMLGDGWLGDLLPFYGNAEHLWMHDARQGRPWARGAVSYSAFVATGVLAASVDWEDQDGDAPAWTRWGMRSHRWWWRLDGVLPLAQPVPVVRGSQGPWRLTPEQVEAINAAGGGL
jgi:hypothetical protein